MFESRRKRVQTTTLYALGVAAAALLLTLAILWIARGALFRSSQAMLESQVGLAAANPDFVAAWQAGDAEQVHGYLASWAASGSGELIAFDGSGTVVARSLTEDAPSELEGRQRTAEGAPIVTVAAPVVAEDETLGYVRWTVGAAEYAERARALTWQIGLVAGAAALIVIVLLFVEVERTARVMRRVTRRLERAAVQDFDGHVLSITPGELGDLARATNRLVDRYRKASKRRAREKDRLTTVLTQISSGALILNETGMVRLINPAAAALLRVAPTDATAMSFVQVVKDHRIAEVWQRSRESGGEVTQTVELGPERSYRVTVTPFLGGNANGHLVIMQDLTALRRLEKVRRDFVSNVSHELRTPLASMSALVDTLRDGALEDPPAASRFLDSMQVEVDKMAQMVEELLELSRLESGQLPLQIRPAEVGALEQMAVERMRAQAERANVALHLEVPEGLPSVMADVERIQQVLINLIHNAIKFTPAGGKVTLTATGPEESTVATPGVVTLWVRDTGAGVPVNEQTRIFERFYKTDRSRASKGTGLGLAIAKHMVQLHGGEIGVRSREGHGSAFWFTLPVNPAGIGAQAGVGAATSDANERDESHEHDEDSD